MNRRRGPFSLVAGMSVCVFACLSLLDLSLISHKQLEFQSVVIKYIVYIFCVDSKTQKTGGLKVTHSGRNGDGPATLGGLLCAQLAAWSRNICGDNCSYREEDSSNSELVSTRGSACAPLALLSWDIPVLDMGLKVKEEQNYDGSQFKKLA